MGMDVGRMPVDIKESSTSALATINCRTKLVAMGQRLVFPTAGEDSISVSRNICDYLRSEISDTGGVQQSS